MKRLIAVGALLVLAIASIVFAQSPAQATLRLPAGDRPVTYFQQGSVVFVSAAEVVTGLGGTLTPDSSGFKVTLNNTVAAFGTDSRYGVVREDLIEMPEPPVTVDGRPFVPWQFFQGLLARSGDLDATWDAQAKALIVRPRQLDTLAAQVSLANVQGISKVVVTLSAASEYTILREAGFYTIRFKSPLRPAAVEQSFEDPFVAKATFAGNDLRLQLTGPDVVADAYQLDQPFRVILDLRKATDAAPVTPGLRGPSQPVDQPGVHTIVIDPGHGGKDVGATGPNGLMEKDTTLQLCRRLASVIAAKTGARVVMTREDDSQVSLDQRTAIANQYHADLFLSVHLNAAPSKGARGSETYFLSVEASDELAKRAADTENASASTPTSAVPSDDLRLILWDLAQQEYLQESSRFAQALQEEMNTATGAGNRGVKQAPFKVLVGATMPAALVEVGFISNPDEEARIKTDEFQNLVVEAITRAVVRYKSEYETRLGIAPAAAPATPATAAPAAGATTTAAVPAPARTGTR
jgi:N-acetylmuramoyl-L-alanine amidase